LAIETPQQDTEKPPPEQSWLEQYAGWITAAVALVIGGLVVAGYNPLDLYHELTAATLRFADWLLEEYGYLAVFLVPLLENSFFLGLLVPGAVILMFAGLGAQQGIIEWYLALPLAIAGAIIGDTLSYFAGRHAWIHVFGPRRVGEWREKWSETFTTRARWVFLFYHFVGYTRLIGPTAAGVLHIPYWRWAPLDYIGVALWVTTFGAVGYLLGVAGLSLEDSDANVRIFEGVIVGMVILWFVVRGFTGSRESDREQAISRDD
jgi:membrane protein DedA with SNARE-associated domain